MLWYFCYWSQAVNELSFTDTTHYSLWEPLWPDTRELKLPLPSHENHSERYFTQGQPCLERGFSAVWCMYITKFMQHSLKPDMKVTVPCHKAHRTGHRGAITQGTCTSTMPQKLEKRTISHHRSILQSHLVCHSQKLLLVREDHWGPIFLPIISRGIQTGHSLPAALNIPTIQILPLRKLVTFLDLIYIQR